MEFSNALKRIEVESVGPLKIIKDKQEQDKQSEIKTCDPNINHFFSSLFQRSAPQCIPTLLFTPLVNKISHVSCAIIGVDFNHVSDCIKATKGLQMIGN